MRSRLSGLASISAGLGRTGRRFANSPRPLRRPSRPCSGRGLSGSVVSHLGPPTAASSTASARAAGVQDLVGERGPVRVDRRAADQVLLELEIADRGEQLARRGRDLRSDPVAGKGCDLPRHGAERYVPRRSRPCRRSYPAPSDGSDHVRRERLRAVRHLHARERAVRAGVGQLAAEVARPRWTPGAARCATVDRVPIAWPDAFRKPLPGVARDARGDRVHGAAPAAALGGDDLAELGAQQGDPEAQRRVPVRVHVVAARPRRRRRRSGPPKPGTDGLTLPTSAGSIFTSARSL